MDVIGLIAGRSRVRRTDHLWQYETREQRARQRRTDCANTAASLGNALAREVATRMSAAVESLVAIIATAGTSRRADDRVTSGGRFSNTAVTFVT